MCLQSGAAVLGNYHQSLADYGLSHFIIVIELGRVVIGQHQSVSQSQLTGGRCCFNEVIALCALHGPACKSPGPILKPQS